MSDSAESVDPDTRRRTVADALLDGPDIVQVLRLTIVEDTTEKTLVVAASVAMVESLPTHVISHALADAKRRIRDVVGVDSDVFLEPDLVQAPRRDEPATDVIVIRASD